MLKKKKPLRFTIESIEHAANYKKPQHWQPIIDSNWQIIDGKTIRIYIDPVSKLIQLIEYHTFFEMKKQIVG